jgi:hypothetical protein
VIRRLLGTFSMGCAGRLKAKRRVLHTTAIYQRSTDVNEDKTWDAIKQEGSVVLNDGWWSLDGRSGSVLTKSCSS